MESRLGWYDGCYGKWSKRVWILINSNRYWEDRLPKSKKADPSFSLE